MLTPSNDGADVVLRIDAADDVIVRIGEQNVSAAADDDAARGVEPCVDGGAVVSRVPLACANDLCRRRFAQHERAGGKRGEHDQEHGAGAQRVDPAHGRGKQRHTRARRPDPDHRRFFGHCVNPTLDDGGRLGCQPDGVCGDGNRHNRANGPGERPPERDACACRGEERRREDDRRHDADAGRPQEHVDAQQRASGRVFLDERTNVEPRPAPDEHADIAIVRPPVVDLDTADGA
jgi:hypothetical protein